MTVNELKKELEKFHSDAGVFVEIFDNLENVSTLAEAKSVSKEYQDVVIFGKV